LITLATTVANGHCTIALILFTSISTNGHSIITLIISASMVTNCNLIVAANYAVTVGQSGPVICSVANFEFASVGFKSGFALI
jgi:hypothetical protein